MTISDAAKYLEITITYAYQLVWGGRLPGIKTDGKWLLDDAAIEAYKKKAVARRTFAKKVRENKLHVVA